MDSECFWCSEGRGAGPLAVTGFQDLQEHSVWYDYGHKALALGVLYIMNKGLATACKRAGVAFPSPLIGETYTYVCSLLLDSQGAWHWLRNGEGIVSPSPLLANWCCCTMLSRLPALHVAGKRQTLPYQSQALSLTAVPKYLGV